VSNEEPLRIEKRNGTAALTLDRPDHNNTLTPELVDRLAEALHDADDDRSIHSITIAGAGRHFCAGYAYPDGRASSGAGMRGDETLDDDIWQLEQTQRKLLTIFDLHKPVIAVVHGACVAGGTDLALLCDLVLCTEDARFGFPATRFMGSPPMHMWLHHIGPQWAKRLLLTGDSINGTDAAELGLVLKALPPEQLEAEVEGLTTRLSLIDPHLLAAQKRIVNLGLELMGTRTLQRLAAETDARAHRAPAAERFAADPLSPDERARAWKETFGPGLARIKGPDPFDEAGRLHREPFDNPRNREEPS